jgi:RHS repeat-associated protein
LTRHQRSAFEPLARGQSPPWRVKGNGSDEVTLQVYPHARYIDEVVGLRVKDQGRLYAHQDANWNVTALTDLTGRVIEQYWYSPYGQLEAHVAAHPFDFDDDGDVDAQDIAAGTSGGTCWGDYDGASGDCKRLDADGDRDIDVDDYNIINGFLTARHSEAALQRIPAATQSRRGNLFGHQGLLLDAELASYQNRARQYAPEARRFMQMDSISFQHIIDAPLTGNVNPYVYARPRMMSQSDVCNDSDATNANGKTSKGWVYCDASGNMTPCVRSDITHDCAKRCIKEHENEHIAHTSCQCGKTYPENNCEQTCPGMLKSPTNIQPYHPMHPNPGPGSEWAAMQAEKLCVSTTCNLLDSETIRYLANIQCIINAMGSTNYINANRLCNANHPYP